MLTPWKSSCRNHKRKKYNIEDMPAVPIHKPISTKNKYAILTSGQGDADDTDHVVAGNHKICNEDNDVHDDIPAQCRPHGHSASTRPVTRADGQGHHRRHELREVLRAAQG